MQWWYMSECSEILSDIWTRLDYNPIANKVHIDYEVIPLEPWELTAQVILNGTAVTEKLLKFTEDWEREFLTDECVILSPAGFCRLLVKDRDHEIY